jgi:ABC-2 type transport system ATP-binding protein
MAVGLLAPDDGRVEILGIGDPLQPAVRARVGVAPQALALYELLTAEENLHFFGTIYGLAGSTLQRRVTAALDVAGLRERAGSRVETFSGGMKRRLNLAAALVHDPDLLVLDEPTVGVDPQSRHALFEAIEALRRQGKTVIYTTHYMEEAERLCDRIAIVDDGRLLALGTLAQLLATYGGLPTLVADTADGSVRRPTADPLETLNELARTTAVHGFHVQRPTLEQVVLQLTGKSLRD